MALATEFVPEGDPKRGFSASNAFAVTPSDTAGNNFQYYSEYFWIGGAGSGNLTVVTAGGQQVTYTGVTVGFFWVRAKQVLATGTDVTGIVGPF